MKIITKETVSKGWSGDKKYHITDETGTSYLLRISPPEQHERRLRQFRNMERAAALGIPMCLPVAFGVCEEGVYSIQSWVDGCDAEEAVQDLSEKEQYAYGYDAGQILQKLHTLPAPDGIESWSIRFNRKIDRKITVYKNCSLKYEDDEPFFHYIAAHRHLLDTRPQTYQHGDYHIGNMMLSRKGVLTIIDFDRDDCGDPWEEFNRIVWCAQKAPAFASGMVDGYFDGSVPMEFWELLALYICSNTLGSLPWAISFGDEQIAIMRRQARDILSWYGRMTTAIPSWYQRYE